MPHLLTVAGSLRAGSSNAALLAAAAQLAPAGLDVAPYRALGSLPAFNPDREEAGARLPSAVTRWRVALARADMLLVSTPEYAHGIVEVLTVMSATIVPAATLVLDLPRRGIDAAALAADPVVAAKLREVLGSLLNGHAFHRDMSMERH